MGLVFNDLGQETKGISTKRLRYGRINTLYSNQPPMTSSILFSLKSQGKKKKKTDEQSFPNFFFYCNNNAQEIKEFSSLPCT
jgi:hypothetical protein